MRFDYGWLQANCASLDPDLTLTLSSESVCLLVLLLEQLRDREYLWLVDSDKPTPAELATIRQLIENTMGALIE